jgi:hypothetical protein
MFILKLFDQIKHVKLLSECINVLFLYYITELCFITRLISGTVP